MSANKETIDTAKKFINVCDNLGNTIFEVSDALTSNDYLTSYNDIASLREYISNIHTTIKTLTETITSLKSTQVYKVHHKQTKMKYRDVAPVNLTEEQKLNHSSDRYAMCDKCDGVILKDGMNEHQDRNICRKKFLAKLSAKNSGKIQGKYRKEIVILDNLLQTIDNPGRNVYIN